MSERERVDQENELPDVAVAALDAASRRAAASGVPLVTVIEDGLYRVSANGEKELIRQLPPRARVSGRAGGPGA
jgi:hypothetical protein